MSIGEGKSTGNHWEETGVKIQVRISDSHLQIESGEMLHFPQVPKPLLVYTTPVVWTPSSEVIGLPKGTLTQGKHQCSLKHSPLYHPEFQLNKKQRVPSRITKQKLCVLNSHCIQTGEGSLPEQKKLQSQRISTENTLQQVLWGLAHTSQPVLTAAAEMRSLPLQWRIWQFCQEHWVRCQGKNHCTFLKKRRCAEEECLKCSF